jgi:tRNA pseudouridine38-40 synthase
MKVVCQLQYHGGYTAGWQEQLSDPSLASCVKSALKALIGEDLGLECAGRTDKDVHAVGQVIAFTPSIERSLQKWKTGLNHFLPSFIRVHTVAVTNLTFHPRYHALARTYRYYCVLDRSPHHARIVSSLIKKPDIFLMNQACLMLLGEHDFSSFRGGSCQAKSPIKYCYSAQWSQKENFFCFEIKANAFLHHMVRYLVGCLLQIGYGYKSLQWFQDLLHGLREQDFCASPEGLYFCYAHYPDMYGLGFVDQRPWFDQLS